MRPSAHPKDAIVYIVDDDLSIREALSSLVRSVGMNVETYSSAAEFLERRHGEAPGCLVLDIRMPGMTGLELQQSLNRSDAGIPIIFITGHGDIPISVRAMKNGAVEFLTKPFNEKDLLGVIAQAVTKHRLDLSQRSELADLRALFQSLTPREREVYAWVSKGLPNKQIAIELGTAEITVKIQRAQVMKKMKVESLADLVKVYERLRPQ